ncbi:MAG: PotD/PotF family extracellular solute-binding protein [Actinomycetes bacterium]
MTRPAPRPRRRLTARDLAVVPPEIRPLVVAQLTRRGVLRGAGALGIGAFLAACGTGGGTGGGGGSAGGTASPGLTPATDLSDSEKVVNWANWTLYLDQDDDGTYPSLVAFTEQTGIEVNYSEDIDGNDTYYGKIQGQLANGDDIGQDIVVFTDWMAARMIRQGYTQELDEANMPNKENILPELAQVDFDPGRKHSLTWQSGFAGIAWNVERVGEMRSVSDLWRPEIKGRVEVLDEMRDTMGLIMLEQGVDISGDWGEDEFGAALEVLEEQISSGQIRQVRGNSYKEDLISEDALAVIGWSGDITQLNFENGEKWAFAIPEAGGTLWSDNMLVPIGSPHKKNAETLMNYCYDPEVAATVAAWVNYISPVQGAREAMEAIDPELVDNPLIFPTEEYLQNVRVFRSLDPGEEQQYNADFQAVIGN